MISVLVVDKCWIDWDFFNAKLLFGQSNILPYFFLFRNDETVFRLYIA